MFLTICITAKAVVTPGKRDFVERVQARDVTPACLLVGSMLTFVESDRHSNAECKCAQMPHS